MFKDRYGLELSTASADAVRHYSAAIDANLAGNGGIQEELDAAVAADEGFALAHVARARNLQFLGRMAESAAAKERALALAAGATRREQQHVAVLATAIDSDAATTLALVREHIAEYPLDAFVLTQANGPFGLIGFGGDAGRHAQQLALLESVAPAYGDDWWFLAAYSFALNELGRFEEARRPAERSLEVYPRSGHGAHTMAHCYFETGDHAGGGDFLKRWLEGYERRAVLHSHLSWHVALFELNCGRPEGALAVYESTLRPAVCAGTAIIAISDAASFLWRQDLYGVERPAGSREELRDFAASQFPRPGLTFADVHCALAYAAAGDWDALDRLVAGLKDRAANGKSPSGDVAPVLAEAVGAFGRGDYERAVQLLEAYRPQIIRIGGSNAQREVFEDTLVEAYLRVGRYDQGEALLRERLARRPNARDEAALARAQARLIHHSRVATTDP
ncbi:MAG: tetratricopeptide repeat protein [Chloroflexi bacterium]|nr:tetratricopeptide repeat protein [Chloroflexota bacterium]